MTPTSLTWKSALGRGAIAIVLGIIAIFWPDTAIFTFMLIWGLWALIDGIAVLFLAFQPEARGGPHDAARPGRDRRGVRPPDRDPPRDLGLRGHLAGRSLLRGPRAARGAVPRSAPRPAACCWRAPRSTSCSVSSSWSNPGGSAKGITVVLGIVALLWGIALVVIGFAWRKQPATPEPAAA